MAFKEEKKPETVREKIAASMIDVFGIDPDRAKMFVSDAEVANEARVDADMCRVDFPFLTTDISALVEFFLDVQTRIGFTIPGLVLEHAFEKFACGRLHVSDLIKIVEDAVTLNVVFKTLKEVAEELRWCGLDVHPGWEAA